MSLKQIKEIINDNLQPKSGFGIVRDLYRAKRSITKLDFGKVNEERRLEKELSIVNRRLNKYVKIKNERLLEKELFTVNKQIHSLIASKFGKVTKKNKSLYSLNKNLKKLDKKKFKKF